MTKPSKPASPIRGGLPKYLLHRNGRYYSRLVVPAALRDSVGKSELRCPLGENVQRAISLHPKALSELRQKIEAASNGDRFRPVRSVRDKVALVAPYLSFSTIIDVEVRRRSLGRDSRPLPFKSEKKYRDIAAEFVKFRDNDNALSVTAGEAKRWLDSMLSAQTLTNKTIAQRVQCVGTILGWARKEDPDKVFPAGNPLSRLRLPQSQFRASYLSSFTLEEAGEILSAARYQSDPVLRWLPFILAYSGMRVSEGSALRRSDFFQHEGRWFVRITTAGGRSLKTLASERRVPIHRALENEGLIEFLLSHDQETLFGSPKRRIGSVPAHLTHWIRTMIPIKHRPDLMPNHGWRHLFEDLCRRDGLPEEARSYITGRAWGNSQSYYGRTNVMLSGLADAIDMIKPFAIADGI